MPYITQDRREGLREHIDEYTSTLRTSALSHEGEAAWQNSQFWDRVERDLFFILLRGRFRPREDALERVVSELRSREGRGEAIGGDINFCLCRYLVGLTQIHLAPRYESKIQWIEERLEGVRVLLTEDRRDWAIHRKPLGIVGCVSAELYDRFAREYEDQKRKPVSMGGNGDIMD